MSDLPEWFLLLRQEYQAQAEKLSPEVQARLLRKFTATEPGIMLKAVDLYMDQERWFPIVATLRPYVEKAERLAGLQDNANRRYLTAFYDLAIRRMNIVKRLHSGDPSSIVEAVALANEFEKTGRQYAAEWIRNEVKKYEQIIA